MNTRVTSVMLVAGAVLANAGFTWLGSTFNYPDILKEPPTEVLALFRERQSQVVAGFLVLAAASALLAPIALGVRRLSEASAMRLAVPFGIAAAIVQVIGLMRWPLLVPGFAEAAASVHPATTLAAIESFETAHRILGNLIGETLGYLFTAVWTGLVVVALGGSFAGWWFVALGAASALLVLSGVLSPLDLPFIDLANFIGYVLWSVWLIAFAIVLVMRGRRPVTT